MNKSFTAKIDIADIKEINPYSDKTNTLAYNIINNSIVGTNGTTLKSVPDTIPAVSISSSKGTGKYAASAMTSSMMPYGFNPWLYADTEAGASSGNSAGSMSCSDLIGKYISDQSSSFSGVLKVESCEGNTPVVNQEVYAYEQELSVTQDDYGTSYYYRGNVTDNYVELNNMCWRIVRIEGDGSIKITLAAQKKCSEITASNTETAFIGTGNYGYTETYVTNSSGATSSSKMRVADYLNGQTDKENSMKTQLDTWLTSSGIDTTKLKQDNWCLGNLTDTYDRSGTLLTDSKNDLMYNKTSFYYDTYRRLYGLGTTPYATLKCSGENYETYSSYIGALTADEVVFAGGKTATSNTNYYLTNNASTNYWWTFSPGGFYNYSDTIFYVDIGSLYFSGDVPGSLRIRPAITLKSNTKITSGDGTQNNPYIIG